MRFLRAIFGLHHPEDRVRRRDRIEAPPAAPIGQTASDVVPSVAASGKILIPGPTTVYEKDLSSPFWAAVAKMQPGAFVRYESEAREWHVFVVEDGPRYGRPTVKGDVSVVVRRVSTRQQFTMPAQRLTPCDRSFAARDGTPIRRGEGYRDG